MATDIGLIVQRLHNFFDFSGKSVLVAGAGGGQFAECARPMGHVVAIDRDSLSLEQLKSTVTRLDMQDRFEFWIGDFYDCDRRGDVVLFEFCLHEMEDPAGAVSKALLLAPEVVVIDHAPGSIWSYFVDEDEKVNRSWQVLEDFQVVRRHRYEGEQRFGNYEELYAKVKSQGDECIKRIERFRRQTDITIPMQYALALVRNALTRAAST